MPRSILVLLGHPDRNSLCGALAERYAAAATEAGHAVRLIALGELMFDPILRHGYRQVQPLEPDLRQAADAIAACDHLVLVYPTWWGAMPALLKGFFDRVLLPGYAFRYRQGSVWWDRLLAGRSARVITPMDTPLWYYRGFYRAPGHAQVRGTILEFCGIRPVRITALGPVRSSTPARRDAWLEKVERLGRAGR
ncbi:NAD(P)H-dependent oxidoreductase [Stenotrophomonas sp. 24(2023)]|uniref:NAD(P)H-dependent oxidoreductase n=1 Tax=Stenotrophomonas sp. 24(2023) TaxID=3068324 RepID=UPI0027E1013F|nr:NAD(P)H-dependent oxidoreductase [Stenotrophomonas sp. 24(2023)]WMJ69041.1 NAD(P)H-dependent oxidoreductase [Stenotrophomonas sp. 24(2023)]